VLALARYLLGRALEESKQGNEEAAVKIVNGYEADVEPIIDQVRDKKRR
jgi:hypothetical protein